MNKVLIVEDNPTSGLILSRNLEKHGYEIIDVVSTGEIALESISRQTPDLVLMDIMLPGKMDGIQTAGKILEEWSIPVIFVSGLYNEEIIQRAAKTLPYAYLRKPVEEHQLIAEVKLALFRREAENKIKEQKARSESELGRAMQLWNMTVDAVPELILIVDESLNIIQANKTLADRLETDKNSLQGRKCYQVLDGLKDQSANCPYLQGHRHGQKFRAERYIEKLKGYFSISSIPFKESRTGRTVSVHVLRDITKRREYEEKLKSSEEKYRRLSEDMPLMVCTYLPDSTLTYVNKAYCDHFGKSEDELLGRKWLDLLPSEDRDKVLAEYHSLTMDSPLKIHEHPALRPDGTTGWQRWIDRALFDDSGRLQYYQAIGSDITTQKQAMNRLRENEKTLNTVLKAIKVSMIVVDLETGKIMRLDETSARFFRNKDAVGQDFEKIMEYMFEYRYKSLSDIVSRLPVYSEEIKLKTRDGVIIPVLFHAFQGEVEHRKSLVLIFHDISERKDLEMKLAHAQKLEAVGELAAGIAHEINTPVQYLGDNTLFLKEAFEDILAQTDKYEQELKKTADKSLLKILDQIKKDAEIPFLASEVPRAIDQSLQGLERIGTIVKAMKKFSHPGRSEEMTYFDLQDALENTITISRNEWKYVADVKTDFGPGLSGVKGYPHDLNQVFLNLVVNAAHAIKEKVEESGEKGEILVKAGFVNEYVEIRISDTGVGIPPNHHDRIFNQFFTTKPVGKGTGQGLAIAYSIVVDQHKGNILFESEPGKGTTFIVRIPQTSRKDTNGQS